MDPYQILNYNVIQIVGCHFSHILDSLFDIRGFVLLTERKDLMSSVSKRCEKIVENGLFEEAFYLTTSEVNPYFTFPLGYRLAADILKGKLISTKEFLEFLKEFKGQTRTFCRKQYAWARKYQKQFIWLPSANPKKLDIVESTFAMDSGAFLEVAESETNREAQEKSLVSPRSREEKKEYIEGVDQLDLYRNGALLKRRVLAINELISKYRKSQINLKM